MAFDNVDSEDSDGENEGKEVDEFEADSRVSMAQDQMMEDAAI